MNEEFRPAIDALGNVYPGYFVSNKGRIASIKKRGNTIELFNGMRVLRTEGIPYKVVTLFCTGLEKAESVHALVARSWIGLPPSPDHQVNHKDGIKKNNEYTNLEWVTPSGNKQHALDSGLHPMGETAYNHKLSDESVRSIRVMSKHGWTQRRLAKLFGVSQRAVLFAIQRNRWRHVA